MKRIHLALYRRPAYVWCCCFPVPMEALSDSFFSWAFDRRVQLPWVLFGLLQLVKGVRCSWTPHLSVGVCLHARCLSCHCSWCRCDRSWNLEKWPPVASHLPQPFGEAVQSGGGRQIFTRLCWLKCQRCCGGFKCVNLAPWIWKWSSPKELQTCLLWLPDLRNKGISAAGVMCVVGWESPRAEGSKVQGCAAVVTAHISALRRCHCCFFSCSFSATK